MFAIQNEFIVKRQSPAAATGRASGIKQFPFQGKVVSKDSGLGLALLLNQEETRSWALAKDDFATDFWARLSVGSRLKFSDNGDGAVVEAEIVG